MKFRLPHAKKMVQVQIPTGETQRNRTVQSHDAAEFQAVIFAGKFETLFSLTFENRPVHEAAAQPHGGKRWEFPITSST